MEHDNNIEKRIMNYQVRTDAEADENILTEILQKQSECKKSTQQKSDTHIWSIIMKSKITKLAAAAAIIIAIGIFVNTLPSKAYAFDETIEAYNPIRFLHVKVSEDGKYGNSETWLQYDKYGNIVNMRFQTPYLGDSVGPLVFVCNNGKSEVWLARFNLHITGYGKPSNILGFDVSTVEPKNLIERLRQQQEQGEIILDINEPAQKNEPIEVTVTYPQDHQSYEYMKVLHIDQATKLVRGIDKFKFEDGEFKHKKTLEFFDYNQEIDPMMFSLEGEVPPEANVIEMPEEAEAGLPQGNMTDEEITIEVIRQFFEAVMDKDYDKAGLLFLCAPGFLVEQAFMGANVLEITEIGQPYPDPDPDSDAMFCSCKAIAEFNGEYYELDNKWMKVQRTGKKPYRWLLTGNTLSINPAPGKVTISKENVSLDEVTYKGLEPGEFMKKWLVLDPIWIYVRGDTLFPSEETQKDYFENDQINTAKFEPTLIIDGKNHEWSLLESEYNTIDLTSVNENWYLVTYLYSQIDMSEEKQATLGIGSDDSVKVWVNGELVHENWVVRGTVIDNDHVPVTFKKGMNQLVIKVENRGGPWGFCCRLLDE